MTDREDRFQRPLACLSDLALDQWIAGEGDAATAQHLRACAACANRRDRLLDAQQDFMRAPWVEESMKRARPKPLWPYPVAMAAAVALVAFGVSSSPTTRTKGALGFDVVAKHRDGRVETLLPGARLAPGESVRFRLKAPRAGYAAVVSADAAPNVTVYYPHEAPTLRIAAHDALLLDGSITLDGTLGAERLVAVVCDAPPSLDRLERDVRAALTAAGGDPARMAPLTTDCLQAAFVIEKIAGP